MPDLFLRFVVDRAVAVSRLTDRRTDPETGIAYNTSNMPSDKDILKRLEIRKDDKPDVIAKRLDT